jgi:hypothetical protein
LRSYLKENIATSVWKPYINGSRDLLRWPGNNLYLQKLALLRRQRRSIGWYISLADKVVEFVLFV